MAKPRLDLVGQTFGELTVVEYAGDGHWRCTCSCGNETNVRTDRLKGGSTKSCGHLARGRNGARVAAPPKAAPARPQQAPGIVAEAQARLEVLKTEQAALERLIAAAADWEAVRQR